MVGEYPGVHEQFADAARVARVECVVLFFLGGAGVSRIRTESGNARRNMRRSPPCP